MRIICASSSKNRQALLDKMGILFEVAEPVYDEVIEHGAHPDGQVEVFALEKARSVLPIFEDEEGDFLILGFDSMIHFDGCSIGKPRNKKGAFEMLRSFVGGEQEVVTGVGIVGRCGGKVVEVSAQESTGVVFRSDISNCQIRRYLEFGDWVGKCGAYSILGTGIFFLEKIEGDFQNIVGVPVLRLGELIREVTGKAPVSVFEVR